ncbi:MAG: DUF3857 and transglutaminase domain-containing protein [Pseudomonadota bacterium]
MLTYSFGRGAARLLAAVVMTMLAAANGHAGEREYQRGAAPDWVHPVKPASASRRQGSGYGGVEVLLTDTQTRIEVHGLSNYRHFASKALDSKGVQEIASISLSFDPTYQDLTLNAIDIVRDGRRISKMGSATIRVLKRETALEYQLFDGHKTVSVTIDDVRVGDMVEYAYLLSGLNPVFGNRVAGGASLQWSVPVDRVFARLLVPQGRNVRLATQNIEIAPVVTEANGYRDYRWERGSVAALRLEKDAPPGFDPYPWVQWTEFSNWEAVVAWALPLYRIPASPGADVTREIERIRAAASTPQQRLLDVLRLVQRDIRYLGVEVGPGSHAPSAPALVYQRRFGDCKDKAMLTLTMLNALGIDARPALVHSDRAIAAGIAATPHAFNHVIVRATLDGKTYWIDPTRAPQKGDLEHLYQADYGLALVLEKGTRALVPMAPPVTSRTSIRTVFDTSKGFDAPASYTIKSTLQGAAADRMRDQIASHGLGDKEMDYLNFYARTYPGIKVTAPLAISDDETKNTLVVTESYAIADFWPRRKGQNRRQAYIDAAEIDHHFAAPKSVNRIAPLRVSYPEEIEEVTEVKLPESWDITEKSSSVHDAAFVYEHQVQKGKDGRSVVLTNTYKARADRVNPAAMAAYAANLRKADASVGYSLYHNDPGQSASNKNPFKPSVWDALLLVCVWIWIGSPRQSSLPEHEDTDRKLLLAFVGLSSALFCVLLVIKAPALPIVVLAALYVGAAILPAISADAPVSHWLPTLYKRAPFKIEPHYWRDLFMVLLVAYAMTKLI